MNHDIMAIAKHEDIEQLESTLDKINHDMQSIKNTKYIEAFKDFMFDIVIDFIDKK